jgi:hypothetical protein
MEKQFQWRPSTFAARTFACSSYPTVCLSILSSSMIHPSRRTRQRKRLRTVDVVEAVAADADEAAVEEEDVVGGDSNAVGTSASIKRIICYGTISTWMVYTSV